MGWTTTRRVILAGGLGAITLAGLGVGVIVSGDVADTIARTLRRLLGEMRIDHAELERFTADYLGVLGERGIGPRTFELLGLVDGLLATPTLRDRLPAPVLDRVERFERHLVTHFTLGTTFFEVADSRRDVITYVGMPTTACRNPFARLT